MAEFFTPENVPQQYRPPSTEAGPSTTQVSAGSKMVPPQATPGIGSDTQGQIDIGSGKLRSRKCRSRQGWQRRCQTAAAETSSRKIRLDSRAQRTLSHRTPTIDLPDSLPKSAERGRMPVGRQSHQESTHAKELTTHGKASTQPQAARLSTWRQRIQPAIGTDGAAEGNPEQDAASNRPTWRRPGCQTRGARPETTTERSRWQRLFRGRKLSKGDGPP